MNLNGPEKLKKSKYILYKRVPIDSNAPESLDYLNLENYWWIISVAFAYLWD
jgi:hypothetical protein